MNSIILFGVICMSVAAHGDGSMGWKIPLPVVVKNRHKFCTDDERSVKQEQLIKINVGSEIISTRRNVLTRVSGSKLAKMINGDCEEISALDTDGNIFLDYQPELFRHLLGQLRLMKPSQSLTLAVPFKQIIEELNFRVASVDKDDIVTLNVGGEIFVTRREILTQVSTSRLATVVSSYDEQVFLDFDPNLFRSLLTQLRVMSSCKPTCVFRPPSVNDSEAFNHMLIQLGLYNFTRQTTNLSSCHAKITASNFCNAQRISCAPSHAANEKLRDILDLNRPADGYWNSGGYAPQYLQLELPRAQTVPHVFLQIAQTPAGRTHHSLLVGAEENALREVKAFVGPTASGDWLNATFSPPLENVRFVRVNTISSPSWVAWTKFLVLGY